MENQNAEDAEREAFVGKYGLRAGAAILGTMLAVCSLDTAIANNCRRNAEELDRAATYLSVREGDYSPVGNGGALAAMNGRTTPERQTMLDRIDHLYNHFMSAQAPVKTLEQYKIAIENR